MKNNELADQRKKEVISSKLPAVYTDSLNKGKYVDFNSIRLRQWKLDRKS